MLNLLFNYITFFDDIPSTRDQAQKPNIQLCFCYNIDKNICQMIRAKSTSHCLQQNNTITIVPTKTVLFFVNELFVIFITYGYIISDILLQMHLYTGSNLS